MVTDESSPPPTKRTKLETTTRREQYIQIEKGIHLGISVDDDLVIQRITDTNSPMIRNARYGVVHWQIIEIDGEVVTTKQALSKRLQSRTEQYSILKLQIQENTPVAILSSQKPPETFIHTPFVQTIPPPPGSTSRCSSSNEVNNNNNTHHIHQHPEDILEEEDQNEAKRILQMGQGIPTFRLGNDKVSRLVTGSCTWQLSPGDVARSDVAITACAAYTVLGCQTFDCGDIYAGVEDLVGKFLATARGHSRDLADRIRIHTKVIPDLQQGQHVEVVQLGQLQQALHSKICASVLRSANRIGVAKLDLVQLHWWDWQVPGLEVALKVLQSLQMKGLVRAVGITNIDLERLERIIRDHQQQDYHDTPTQYQPPVACVQVNLSLIDRRPLNSGLAQLCKTQGIAFLAHGCLCGGLLSEDWLNKPQPELSSLAPGMALNLVLIQHFGGWKPFQDLLLCLATIAAKHTAQLIEENDVLLAQDKDKASMSHDDRQQSGEDDEEADVSTNKPTSITISMIAIAWTLRQSGVNAVVLGARNCKHVNDAAYAVSSLQLDDNDIVAIGEHTSDSRGPHGPVYGLERIDPRLVALAGSGADGSLNLPVDRTANRATTPDHLNECAKRLYILHSVYQDSMPSIPADLADYCTALNLILRNKENLDNNRKSWMSASAYEHLNPNELVQLLRDFVAEIDCIPATATSTIDSPSGTRPTITSRRLRAFAATMLASSEQARFVQQRQSGSSSLRNHRSSSDAAAAVARASLHAKFVKQLQTGIHKQGGLQPTGSDNDAGNEPCLIQ